MQDLWCKGTKTVSLTREQLDDLTVLTVIVSRDAGNVQRENAEVHF